MPPGEAMRLVHLGILALTLVVFTGVSDNPANAQRTTRHAGSKVAYIPAAQHEGQPDTCNNFHDNEHKCDCHNAQEDCTVGKQTRSGEDPKCQVYCRPDACKCVNPCDT